jgi:hypothetical protein
MHSGHDGGWAVSSIPQRSRDLVKTRARFRCEICGSPAPTGAWHHRRSRSVVDEHTHHPCNGIWLCNSDHTWVHRHPTQARRKGWIVSRYVDEPGAIPVASVWGDRVHHCNGTFTFTKEQP